MARRALELRITEDGGSWRSVAANDASHRAGDGRAGDDRRLIAAMRLRLRDQREFVSSWEAIQQSRDLLARAKL